MSLQATAPAYEPTLDLLEEDGEPLETQWHQLEMTLLIEVTRQAMEERGHRRFFVGGNMFVYYSTQQAQAIAAAPASHREFKGPDFFFVSDVDPHERKYWVVWEEGRSPELVVELVSPSTRANDWGEKKDVYEKILATPEYFLYDRERDELAAWHLLGGAYRRVLPTGRGRARSPLLGLELGRWWGRYRGVETTWIRLYHPDGRLVPTDEERAEQERERADQADQRAEQADQRAKQERERAEQERERAEAAERELLRLRARLAEVARE